MRLSPADKKLINRVRKTLVSVSMSDRSREGHLKDLRSAFYDLLEVLCRTNGTPVPKSFRKKG